LRGLPGIKDAVNFCRSYNRVTILAETLPQNNSIPVLKPSEETTKFKGKISGFVCAGFCVRKILQP
jgi:hypothetical protein